MTKLFDTPVLTPEKLLEKRGAYSRVGDVDTAIICFRGHKASVQLIQRFEGNPIKGAVLYHPQLYHSSQLNVLIVPEMVWGGPITAIVIEELFALGVRTLIGFGVAGSINPKVNPGAMFVAQKAICVDGTSKEYLKEKTCMLKIKRFFVWLLEKFRLMV